MKTRRELKPIPAEMLQARRLALSAMIAEGGLPRPGQFIRAGLPVLVRASDLLAVETITEAMDEARGARPGRKRPGPQF
jgi:hypothetical protein